jgi:hypothetical protein
VIPVSGAVRAGGRRGRAHVAEESIDGAPEFSAVAIEVEQIDDHRMPGAVVESSVGVKWSDERLPSVRVEALQALAGTGQ